MSEKHGKDMHYACHSNVSIGRLKQYVATAKTPEERRQYTQDIRKPHGTHNAAGSKR